MTFHKDGTLPMAGEIFVFGSNLAGQHGAGAAKVARDLFGARTGVGFGMSGLTFAFPTKDSGLITLPLHLVQASIEPLVDAIEAMPDTEWFITRVGCGLAGYTDAEIAPMFRGFPDTCSFAEQWREFLGGKQ